MSFRISPVALLIVGLFPLLGHAAENALPLKLDRTFKKHPVSSEGTAAFIEAKHVEAKKGEQLEASGDVELRQNGQVINAAYLLYGQVSKDVLAEGAVRLEQPGVVLMGPVLKLNMDTEVGEMSQPRFEFSENHARGTAVSMHIASKQNYSFDDATYTTCPAGNDDWLLRMGRLDIDRTTQIGVARHARVEFMGVPILYTPWMDFALNSNPRSGFLGPIFGSSNKGGAELTMQYYWRIANNFDATFAPRYIAKRGIQLNNEFRYLEPSYQGEIHADVLPNDRLEKLTRTRQSWMHGQNLGGGFGLALNINRVSDNTYFSDLASSVSGTSQAQLPRDGALSYGGGWWSSAVRVQRFQVLQGAQVYRRQPQVTLNAQQTATSASVVFAGEYADFRHDTSVSGERVVAYPSVSYPLLSDTGYYMTPKLGVHYSQYRLGSNNTTGMRDTERTLPIFSVDSGLVLERDVQSFFGDDYLQTLEPRLFYVNIPYKDQDRLPVFDTAQAPFNFSQIFTENRFIGNDRIGDANMATVAVTSRIIDNEGGMERLRVMLGERFSFHAPRVYLPGAPTDNSNRSDILVSLGGRLTKAWSMDSLFQYNPNQAHTQSYNVMARYRPEAGKLLNLGYRFDRNQVPLLRQMDVSTQWPLFGRWQGVARLNYSLSDKRTVEALSGLEYNQSCWAVRLVAQSFTNLTRERSTQIFLQLELNDLVPIGSDPLGALRTSIFGYTKMNSLPTVQPDQGLR